jgi:hypothetical protein
VIDAEGSDPEHLVLVVPGDLEHGRFVELTEAAELAGLPEPSWLPDVVARTGEHLAGLAAGTPVVVVDARRDQIVAWSTRAADDGVEISCGGAIDLTERLDALVSGVVYAKLDVVDPELAGSLRRRTDAAGRRDAAHLGRELREARRLMCTTDGEELIVTAGDAEVYLTRAEFTGLVDHALRETLRDALGDDGSASETIVVADVVTPVVEQLTAATRATELHAPAGTSALGGAAALVLPRPALEPAPEVDNLADATPTDGVPLPAEAAWSAPSRPPRWAVPALSALLAVSLAGAGTVLAGVPVTGTPGADLVSTVVGVGLDRPADVGR